MMGCTRVAVDVGVKVELSVKVGVKVESESPESTITSGSMTQNLVGGHVSVEVGATSGGRSMETKPESPNTKLPSNKLIFLFMPRAQVLGMASVASFGERTIAPV